MATQDKRMNHLDKIPRNKSDNRESVYPGARDDSYGFKGFGAGGEFQGLRGFGAGGEFNQYQFPNKTDFF